MKQTLLFSLFLLSLFSHGQEPSDSVFFHEMEDSISAMSFVQIKKPKALLDSIIAQVIRDSQQKPLVCKYQVEEKAIGLHKSTYRCEFHAKANIRIKATGEPEEFHYEGTPILRNYYDTARVCYAMRDFCLEGAYMLLMVQRECMNDETLPQGFERLMRLHRVKVYRISDESGRGVYRVDFSPRNYDWYGFDSRFMGTAYFDIKTLRLKQIKTDKISATSFDSMMRQAKKPLSHTHLERYQMDFEETGGRNVVRQIEDSIFVDNQLSTTYIIKRLP
jgi:hypothetical protein